MLESISIVNLTKKYGDNCALDNISIDFTKNKIYAILGHNGAGKSTLVKEILGFNTKRNKSIHYITSKNTEGFPKYRMSFSPEKYELLEDLTVDEYLMFVSKLYKQHNDEVIERIDHLLKLFELEEQRRKFIFTLSNGMKKKVCHIAALAVKTEFAILDEPFAALDPVSIFHLKKYLIENLEDRAFIICTHQLDIIDKLDIEEERLEIILMNKGVIKFKGVKQNLFTNTGFDSIEKAYVQHHNN